MNSCYSIIALRFRSAVALLGIFCLLSGCGRPATSQNDSSDRLAPMRVTTVQPQRKTLVRTVELPGRAKVTGYVQKIPVDIGDIIQGPKGDSLGSVLCELLIPELNEDLAERNASIAQTKAEVLQMDAGVKVSEAMVLSAAAAIREVEATVAKEEARYTRWQSEYQRVAELAKSGAVTKKVAEETRAEMDVADAGRKEVAAKINSVTAMHQEAMARLEKAKADAIAIRARLDVTVAEKQRAETMLEYSTLRAPFDGVVVERNVHTGHLVQAGSPKPLLTVMRLDPIRVFVDIPEDDAVHVSKQSKVELRVPSLTADTYVGTVTRTAWSLNTTSRTMVAEIDVPNPEGRWRPGLYVHAKITVAELPNVLSIPRAAIVTQDKLTYCFCVDTSGKVERRPVSLGLQAGTEIEIRSGLTGDEQVITVNANVFREGQTVEIAAPAK